MYKRQTICSVEKVTHKDGEVLTQAGTVVPEESVEKATDSIVKAAVVRSCVVDDAVVGYMSSHKRVVDDSGSVLGTFDGTDIMHGGQSTNLGAQTGEVVSLEDLSDAAFRGAAQAGVALNLSQYSLQYDWSRKYEVYASVYT